MSILNITLLGEPRGKGRPRFSRKSGHAYTPETTVSFENALRHEAAIAMRGKPIAEGPLTVVVTATFGIPPSWSKRKKLDAQTDRLKPTKKPDADNILKMLDALNQVVWRDDSQITDATIVKRYGDAPGLRVIVFDALADRLTYTTDSQRDRALDHARATSAGSRRAVHA